MYSNYLALYLAHIRDERIHCESSEITWKWVQSEWRLLITRFLEVRGDNLTKALVSWWGTGSCNSVRGSHGLAAADRLGGGSAAAALALEYNSFIIILGGSTNNVDNSKYFFYFLKYTKRLRLSQNVFNVYQSIYLIIVIVRMIF